MGPRRAKRAAYEEEPEAPEEPQEPVAAAAPKRRKKKKTGSEYKVSLEDKEGTETHSTLLNASTSPTSCHCVPGCTVFPPPSVVVYPNRHSVSPTVALAHMSA